MKLSTFLMGVLPLVVFVLIDSFAGVKAGIISALVFALAELAYTLIVYGQLDEITLISLATVLILGLLSYKTGSSLFFKMQPVILGVLFGGVLLVMHFMDKPLLVMLVQKYRFLVPEDMRARMLEPHFLVFLKKCSVTLGVGFLLHAGLVAYAALKLSNWWWLALRGLGVYVMMFLSMMAALVI